MTASRSSSWTPTPCDGSTLAKYLLGRIKEAESGGRPFPVGVRLQKPVKRQLSFSEAGFGICFSVCCDCSTKFTLNIVSASDCDDERVWPYWLRHFLCQGHVWKVTCFCHIKNTDYSRNRQREVILQLYASWHRFSRKPWDIMGSSRHSNLMNYQVYNWFACQPMQAFDDSDMAEAPADRTYVRFSCAFTMWVPRRPFSLAFKRMTIHSCIFKISSCSCFPKKVFQIQTNSCLSQFAHAAGCPEQMQRVGWCRFPWGMHLQQHSCAFLILLIFSKTIVFMCALFIAVFVWPSDTLNEDPCQHGYEADEAASACHKNKNTLLAPTPQKFPLFGCV